MWDFTVTIMRTCSSYASPGPGCKGTGEDRPSQTKEEKIPWFSAPGPVISAADAQGQRELVRDDRKDFMYSNRTSGWSYWQGASVRHWWFHTRKFKKVLMKYSHMYIHFCLIFSDLKKILLLQGLMQVIMGFLITSFSVVWDQANHLEYITTQPFYHLCF